MSVEIISQVFKRYPHGGGERLLALALADCANPDGTRIFPSVNTLALMSAQSERSVQRQLLAMLASGWLILVRKSSGRRGDATEYRISPQWLEGGAPVPPEAVPARCNRNAATGDSLSPVARVTLTPSRVTLTPSRVTPEVLTGDTAMSPNPSLTVIEPSKNKERCGALFADDAPMGSVAARIPLVDGSEHAVSEADVFEWRAAYPAVDVPQQLLAMRQWCIANRANRKTARGVRSFIVRWLARAQDQAPRQRAGPGAAPRSFAVQDREAAMRRWEQMTGCVHPGLAPQSTVIDIAPAAPAMEGFRELANAGH